LAEAFELLKAPTPPAQKADVVMGMGCSRGNFFWQFLAGRRIFDRQPNSLQVAYTLFDQ